VPGEFAWDDIGDFRSLSEVLGDAAGDVRVLGDADLVSADAATGLVVPGSGRLVALVGVDDVVVVDTPDALLVTTRAHAQEVKAIVDRLRETGRADLT
jgi:mannose-1-phosphate guanylyltransferase